MSKKEIVTNNIKPGNNQTEILKKYFSDCFDKTGNFQLEKFKQRLAENEIDFSKESYSMNWLGKSYARLLASDAATTLLREDTAFNEKEENKNAENLLIKGDNLEVLKHLVNAYYEKVKMIYIDPPYNTGGDGFVYQDNRKFSKEDLMELAGVDEEEAQQILDFTQSKSNSHSAWLTFMYPRLYIAKQLLREDGVIFISIDDNEVAQLKILMDEIFGEENFFCQIIVRANSRGRTYNQIAQTHEYLLIYTKSNTTELYELQKKDDKLDLDFKDDIGNFSIRELRNRNPKFGRHNRPNLFYPIYINTSSSDRNGFFPVSLNKTNDFDEVIEPFNSKGLESCWRWGKERTNKNISEETSKSNLIAKQKREGGFNIYEKYRKTTYKPKSIWEKNSFLTETGTIEFKKLGFNNEFDFPKPINLLKRSIEISIGNENELILDFFAGSGTTGDAVMQLNAEDGGNRKYILVQLPEELDKKKDKSAYDFVKNELKAEHPTIFEITKERLIRAAKKINEELDEKTKKSKEEIKKLKGELPTEETQEKIEELEEIIAQNESVKTQNVFKIFETQPIWEDYHLDAKELETQTKLFDESKLTAEDIQALLITWKTYDGIALTEDLEKISLTKYTAWYGQNRLYLMNKGFSTENLKEILVKIDSEPEFNPASIIAFGYHFESKHLREISENVKSYANKKNVDVDFIVRY